MDSSAIFEYHRDMISCHGERSSLALGWCDRESQTSRFKALAAIANLNNCSVLDAGCGYADLLPYLHHLYPNLKHYYGVEQIPELLTEAEDRYDDLEYASFISGNFLFNTLPQADYVLACGSLNYTSSDPDFIYKAIAKLYNTCRLGLGFNLLNTVPYEGILVAYNPQNIVDYCRTLGKNVVLKSNYAPEDFTVFVYR